MSCQSQSKGKKCIPLLVRLLQATLKTSQRKRLIADCHQCETSISRPAKYDLLFSVMKMSPPCLLFHSFCIRACTKTQQDLQKGQSSCRKLVLDAQYSVNRRILTKTKIMLNCFGWKCTLDLPGLTQVIQAFQDQTYMATLVRDGDHCVLSLSRNKETTACITSSVLTQILYNRSD